MIPVTVLVVAKAPVPGLAKTRLAATLGEVAAADIAAAALLDTLDAVAATPVAARVVALTGDLDLARDGDEIRSRLREFVLIGQRGDGFAARLANAHADAAAATGGLPVLQIGMDTPQVTAELLGSSARALIGLSAGALLGCGAVLGMACDGGWWVLGVTAAATAECLREVPMSTPDTGSETLSALRRHGIDVELLPELADVDTVADIPDVRTACPPGSRFRRATAQVHA
ncbi:TIGR04282 family arsenosugar biosynthesis glycosyltransferase [Mycolicibacterium sp.]|uniref:TIGR04282 family arsenosugar biosynthesis glycosyltransferase n=1 Tax=Mycolicibacterium sp. TaxID=2320850 RepID=UPI003D12BE76